MLPFSDVARTDAVDLLKEQDVNKKLHHLLSFAAFAPSVHNTQPWRVNIQSPTQCTIFLEKNIQLPQADPTGRGGFLALGAFVENFSLAATACGTPVETRILGSGLETRVEAAWQSFGEKQTDASHKTLEAIRTRATSRGLFSPIANIQDVVAQLAEPKKEADVTLTFITDQERLKKIAELIREGTRLAYGDRSFCAEHAAWLRPNWTFHRDGIPGYAIGIPTPLSFLVPFAIRYKDMREERAEQEYAKACSTNLYVVLSTTNDTPHGWLRAGRRLQRLLVDCTRLGLVQSPNAAPVEMGDLYTEVATLTDTNGRPQLLVRIGNGSAPKRLTPRLPVSSFLR